ncbi:VOC family protein [Microvirga sp. W0021]|uniref:VOC family protein n=1 Tax=Hohaiivirga grylli TaxID=3133970 RepID=A0ABV0BJJ4_9HYPH
MQYAHSMIRVSNLDETIAFFDKTLGLIEIRRYDSEKGQFTNVFLASEDDVKAHKDGVVPCIELTYNWGDHTYTGGRNFGHLAFYVDDLYAACQRILDAGVEVNRPPRDGHLAFFKTPDGISIELIQKNGSLPVQEPWVSMPNSGTW